jgi:hypothetical protein
MMGAAKAKRAKKQDKETRPALPFQWYAEKSAFEINAHNAECKDPACTNDIRLSFTGKMVAMVKSHEPKKLFIAEYSTDSAKDYQPVYILNLETGEEIAGSFGKDGTARCEVTGGHNTTDTPICLTLLCHQKGIHFVVHRDAPDLISLVCAEPTCRRPIKSDNTYTWKMKLEHHPAVEYPDVFCCYHGVQTSYMACCHVAHGTKPLILNRPEPDVAGLAFCSDECFDGYERAVGEFAAGNTEHRHANHRVCAKHLDDLLGGKLEHYHWEADTNPVAAQGALAVTQ